MQGAQAGDYGCQSPDNVSDQNDVSCRRQTMFRVTSFPPLPKVILKHQSGEFIMRLGDTKKGTLQRIQQG